MAASMNNSGGSFPGPYVNTVKEMDPMIKRIDTNKMDIGARDAGMPDNVRSEGMTIKHVGTGD